VVGVSSLDFKVTDTTSWKGRGVEHTAIKQVIVVRRDVNMRKGKLATQVAHASMKFILDNNESERADELLVKLSNVEALWITGPFTKVVVGCDSEDDLKRLIARAEIDGIEVHTVIDSGATEFHGVPTLTCAAFGPDKSEVIDEITGHLKLM
jgi:peptidyl-tRNA hydrolase, PTH2 family